MNDNSCLVAEPEVCVNDLNCLDPLSRPSERTSGINTIISKFTKFSQSSNTVVTEKIRETISDYMQTGRAAVQHATAACGAQHPLYNTLIDPEKGAQFSKKIDEYLKVNADGACFSKMDHTMTIH